MPSARSLLGRRGEELAAAHLVRNGYTLLARNWRCALGEIDMVARRGEQVVFVEVKTRRDGGWSPEESISPRKANRLRELAYAYLAETDLPPECVWRIDVIAIELGAAGQVTRLEQIEYAVGDG